MPRNCLKWTLSFHRNVLYLCPICKRSEPASKRAWRRAKRADLKQFSSSQPIGFFFRRGGCLRRHDPLHYRRGHPRTRRRERRDLRRRSSVGGSRRLRLTSDSATADQRHRTTPKAFHESSQCRKDEKGKL